MKRYTVQIKGNRGADEQHGFESLHSANRCFASYVLDYGIASVMLIDDSNALVIGQWVNTVAA